VSTVYFLYCAARVQYVDYGNEELLEVSAVRHLHPKFCSLPVQAIKCSMKNIEPLNLSASWTEEVTFWFTSLLYGSSITISIRGVNGPNSVHVDALVPASQLTHSLLTNFDPLSDCNGQSSDSLSVSQFMCNTGLAMFGETTLPSEVSSEEEISSEEEVSSEEAESGNLQSTSLPVKESSMCCGLSDLPSLVVKLTESNEFVCMVSMVSMVSNDMHMYVHPADSSVAHNISSLQAALQDHYCQEVNRVPVPSCALKNGNLCVVFSQEFEEWCRVVIVAVQSDLSTEIGLNCLVFFIDYGGSMWDSSGNLFCLTPSLTKYPATVVCCVLKDSQTWPAANQEVLSSGMYTGEREVPLPESALSVAGQVENKPLVAVVRVEQG